MIIIIIIFNITIGLTTSYFFHKKWNTPLSIYTLSWNIPFLLQNLYLVDYYRVTKEASFYIVISYVMFYIGYASNQLIGKSKTIVKKNGKVTKNCCNIDYKYFETAIIIAIVFSMFGFIGYLFYLYKIFGNWLFIMINPYLLREVNVPSIFFYFMIIFSIGGSILIGLLISVGVKIKPKYYLIIIPPVGVGILTGQRILVIYCLTTILISIILFSDKMKNRKLTLFFLSIFLFLFFIYVAQKRGSLERYSNRGKIENSAFLHIYIYISGSYAAFSEALKNWNGKLQWGVNTFLPLFKIFNLIDPNFINAKLIENRPFVFIPFPFNVYTYLWDIVNDFGYIGIIVFNWVLGVLTNKFWNKTMIYNTKITLSRIGLIAITSYLFYSFISSLSTLSAVWYGYIYAIFVYFIKKLKQKYY